ncbi:hypothetical protein BJX99DRAFT_262888 [Aspergillus californicus]
MPPKRTAENPPAASSKRAKTDTTSSAPKIRSKRWSAVSVSGNLQQLYQERVKYDDWKCDDDDEDEDEDKDADDNDKPKKAKCSNGKMCLCNKPATEHPEHPDIISVAGFQKCIDQLIHTNLHNPDLFEMLDADTVDHTWGLIGHMFVTILAKLESQKLLKPDPEVKNLGVIMSLYLQLADELRQNSLLSEDDADGETFDPSHFDAYVLAYGKKYQIKLQGPSDLDKLVRKIEESNEEIKLPRSSADPWRWNAAHKGYAKEYGAIGSIKKKGMGGDSFDITA